MIWKTKWTVITALCTLASPACSQDWNVQEGDERLSGQELTEMLVGQSLVYETGQRSVFMEDGTYEFHVGGDVYTFTYFISDEGAVCIVSSDAGARCDLIVMAGETLVSINENGERYAAAVE